MKASACAVLRAAKRRAALGSREAGRGRCRARSGSSAGRRHGARAVRPEVRDPLLLVGERLRDRVHLVPLLEELLAPEPGRRRRAKLRALLQVPRPPLARERLERRQEARRRRLPEAGPDRARAVPDGVRAVALGALDQQLPDDDADREADPSARFRPTRCAASRMRCRSCGKKCVSTVDAAPATAGSAGLPASDARYIAWETWARAREARGGFSRFAEMSWSSNSIHDSTRGCSRAGVGADAAVGTTKSASATATARTARPIDSHRRDRRVRQT